MTEEELERRHEARKERIINIFVHGILFLIPLVFAIKIIIRLTSK